LVKLFFGRVGSFWSCQVWALSGWQIAFIFHSKGFVKVHPDRPAHDCSSAKLIFRLIRNLIRKPSVTCNFSVIAEEKVLNKIYQDGLVLFFWQVGRRSENAPNIASTGLRGSGMNFMKW